MQQKEFKLTQQSIDKLKEELLFLKTVREKEVAEQIKEARSFGDLSENSEYDEAKNEQGKVFSRMAEVENILSNVVLITEEMFKADEVSHGAKIVVEDVEFGDQEEYYIVGSQEANPSEMRISDESPFGKALVGKKIGETAIVEAPMGNITYRIVSISK